MAARQTTGGSLSSPVDRIARSALSEWGVPQAVTDYAKSATLKRFGDAPGLQHVPEARIEAYFWGVVRRRAFRGGRDTSELRRRFVQASLAS